MQRVLYEWRNLPKQHCYSPAQLMFERSQQLLLPQPAGVFSPSDMVEAAAAMDKKFEAAAIHYDRDIVSLPAFRPGQCVLIQCDKSKKWDHRGEIIDIRPDGLSYLVNLEGKVIVRGRAMLKPVFESGQDQDQDQGEGEEGEFSSSPDILSSPRRSRRLKEKEKCSMLPVPRSLSPAFPGQDHPGFPLLPPQPTTSGCTLQLGGHPSPRPISSRPLPYRQFPPVVYHGGHQSFSQCGFPG